MNEQSRDYIQIFFLVCLGIYRTVVFHAIAQQCKIGLQIMRYFMQVETNIWVVQTCYIYLNQISFFLDDLATIITTIISSYLYGSLSNHQCPQSNEFGQEPTATKANHIMFGLPFRSVWGKHSNLLQGFQAPVHSQSTNKCSSSLRSNFNLLKTVKEDTTMKLCSTKSRRGYTQNEYQSVGFESRFCL